MSEKHNSRSAWDEIAEHFEKLAKALEALAAYEDNASSIRHIHPGLQRATTAAKRGAHAARRQADGGEDEADERPAASRG